MQALVGPCHRCCTLRSARQQHGAVARWPLLAAARPQQQQQRQRRRQHRRQRQQRPGAAAAASAADEPRPDAAAAEQAPAAATAAAAAAPPAQQLEQQQQQQQQDDPGQEQATEMQAFQGLSPEVINSRLSMLGFAVAALRELAQGIGVVEQVERYPLITIAAFVLVTAASWMPFLQGQSYKVKSGPFTPALEVTLGRIAMIGFVGLVLNEAYSGRPFFPHLL